MLAIRWLQWGWLWLTPWDSTAPCGAWLKLLLQTLPPPDPETLESPNGLGKELVSLLSRRRTKPQGKSQCRKEREKEAQNSTGGLQEGRGPQTETAQACMLPIQADNQQFISNEFSPDTSYHSICHLFCSVMLMPITQWPKTRSIPKTHELQHPQHNLKLFAAESEHNPCILQPEHHPSLELRAPGRRAAIPACLLSVSKTAQAQPLQTPQPSKEASDKPGTALPFNKSRLSPVQEAIICCKMFHWTTLEYFYLADRKHSLRQQSRGCPPTPVCTTGLSHKPHPHHEQPLLPSPVLPLCLFLNKAAFDSSAVLPVLRNNMDSTLQTP